MIESRMVKFGWLDWNKKSVLCLLLYERVHKSWIPVSSLGDVEDYVVVGDVSEYEENI